MTGARTLVALLGMVEGHWLAGDRHHTDYKTKATIRTLTPNLRALLDLGAPTGTPTACGRPTEAGDPTGHLLAGAPNTRASEQRRTEGISAGMSS